MAISRNPHPYDKKIETYLASSLLTFFTGMMLQSKWVMVLAGVMLVTFSGMIIRKISSDEYIKWREWKVYDSEI